CSSEVDVSSSRASASNDAPPRASSSLARVGAAGRSAASSPDSSRVSNQATGTAGSQPRVNVAGREAWQPWGVGPRSFHAYAGNGNGPSSSLGGLWKLMGFGRAGSTAANVAAPASTPAPRPERA